MIADPGPVPPEPVDLVVRARRAVLRDGTRPAAVAVVGERVVAVTDPADAPPAREVVDLADDEVLLPGLVDSHVHAGEPGRTEWEGFATATRAAAAGGTTALVDMPLHSIPSTVTPEALAVKRAAARDQVAVDVAFWGGAVPMTAGEPDPAGAVDPDAMAALARDGVVGFTCLLTDSGVPGFPPVGPVDLHLAARTCAELGLPLVVHAEDDAVLAGSPAASADYAGFLASHPPAAETVAVRRLAEVADDTGARIHVLHVSAVDAAAEIAAARAAGIGLSGETCPHHLSLAAEALTSTAAKCCPPVRSRANRDQLWGALVAGALDAVVSDHSPCPPELKTGGFAQAWAGVSSLELALRVVWTGAAARGLGLDHVVRWMATGPAALAGLSAKGVIEVGRDADLVVFAPDDTDEVDPRRLHHRHPVTPYTGIVLRGGVRRVWLRGAPVDPAVPPGGRLLTPSDQVAVWR